MSKPTAEVDTITADDIGELVLGAEEAQPKPPIRTIGVRVPLSAPFKNESLLNELANRMKQAKLPILLARYETDGLSLTVPWGVVPGELRNQVELMAEALIEERSKAPNPADDADITAQDGAVAKASRKLNRR